MSLNADCAATLVGIGGVRILMALGMLRVNVFTLLFAACLENGQGVLVTEPLRVARSGMKARGVR